MHSWLTTIPDRHPTPAPHLFCLECRLQRCRVVAPTRKEHEAVLVLERLCKFSHRAVQHQRSTDLAGQLPQLVDDAVARLAFADRVFAQLPSPIPGSRHMDDRERPAGVNSREQQAHMHTIPDAVIPAAQSW
eukprot:363291-Chlamydomonas_euryale.AAC.22